jgi:hypothetical protein
MTNPLLTVSHSSRTPRATHSCSIDASTARPIPRPRHAQANTLDRFREQAYKFLRRLGRPRRAPMSKAIAVVASAFASLISMGACDRGLVEPVDPPGQRLRVSPAATPPNNKAPASARSRASGYDTGERETGYTEPIKTPRHRPRAPTPAPGAAPAPMSTPPVRATPRKPRPRWDGRDRCGRPLVA